MEGRDEDDGFGGGAGLRHSRSPVPGNVALESIRIRTYGQLQGLHCLLTGDGFFGACAYAYLSIRYLDRQQSVGM